HSTPIALAPDGAAVWVTNPDSNTVAKIDPASHTRLGEYPAGDGPRTLAVTADAVYVASQHDDAIIRLGLDGSAARRADLGFGCAPYAIVAAGGQLYVSCEGPSTLVVLDTNLPLLGNVPLAWPEARALAVADSGLVYVTHFLTKEPNNSGHVSEVDPAAGRVVRVLEIPPDFATCETLGSGQGIANLLGGVVVGSGATAGQLWVGGTLHNALRKGLFERSTYFQDKPGVGLFPSLDFQSNPAGEHDNARRNLYKPARHDIARAAVWKLDLGSGQVRTRLDLAGGGSISALAFSAAGDVAYAVDVMANAYYVFSTARGESGNAATLFGAVAAFGPGGAQPDKPCSSIATDVVPEDPHLLPPQARLVATGGMQPLDAGTLLPADTGLEYTVGTGVMRAVPDGVGTTPTGLALSADGSSAYVADYLARNVVAVAASAPGYRCQNAPMTACRTRTDCAGGDECMPLVDAVVSSIAPGSDLLPPEILDGKILFSTSARDAAGANRPIPPFDALDESGHTTPQGEVTSTARAGASLACPSFHA